MAEIFYGEWIDHENGAVLSPMIGVALEVLARGCDDDGFEAELRVRGAVIALGRVGTILPNAKHRAMKRARAWFHEGVHAFTPCAHCKSGGTTNV